VAIAIAPLVPAALGRSELLPAGPLLLTGYDSMISRMPQARSTALHSQSLKNQRVIGLNPLTTFRAGAKMDSRM
jgi:hypothetical protein